MKNQIFAFLFFALFINGCGPRSSTDPVPTAPAITSISPASGAAGTLVTITGTNFKTAPTDNVVKFNGVVTAVQTATASSLTVTAPAGGSTGPITLTTTDGVATGPAFTYQVIPVNDDVYILASNQSVYSYFKNEIGTNLPSDCAYAGNLFVSGSDVYVGGWDRSNRPKYWKNGVGVDLSAKVGEVFSITASGNDVYAAGYEGSFGTPTPVLWKNGVEVKNALPSLNYARANFVVASGTDLYVAGFTTTKTGKTAAMYWKNGTTVYLTDSTQNANATSIHVSGNDVYVSGSEDGQSPFYWKNGKRIAMDAAPGTFTGTSIYVNGTDVHVAGTLLSGSVTTVQYWKNSTRQILTPALDFEYINRTGAFIITGKGSNIYLAGTTSQTGYWKNGTFKALLDASYVYGICVR
jgi:hypothetical protein